MANHKVAIVNRTNLKNFGSVLQVYALCQAVQKLGYESEVVWQSGNMSKNFDIRPNKLLKVGIKALLHPSLVLSLYKMVREAKKVIVDPEKVRLMSLSRTISSSRSMLQMNWKEWRLQMSTTSLFAAATRYGLRLHCILTP